MTQRLNEALAGHALAVMTAAGEIVTAEGRGVRPLYTLYKERPEALRGATVADRVVGSGAAAIMVAAGIGRLETPAISRPALDLLTTHGISVEATRVVEMIVNRAGTGPCPVEALTSGVDDIGRCIELIEGFFATH